nr:GNAT family N-acetyltransferase [Acidobacteriota bacterium]
DKLTKILRSTRRAPYAPTRDGFTDRGGRAGVAQTTETGAGASEATDRTRAGVSGAGANVRVRPARSEDAAFIIPLVPRLAEFGPPPWHDPAVMTESESRVILEALRAPSEREAIYVAEDGGLPLGFIHVVTETDYFTRAPHGHVSTIVVAPAGERRGAGRALMRAGEEWARSRGYRLLTLNVFERNRAALDFYERLGYAPDTFKYAKPLERRES